MTESLSPIIDVPDAWWMVACEQVKHPLACVGIDNKFIWVNSEWSRMLGYAKSELIGKTWMDISRQEDVGADNASIREVLDGDTSEYYMEKMYKRKDGTYIPVALYVHRFPETGDVLCFIVDVKNLAKDTAINDIKKEFLELEASIRKLNEEVIIVAKKNALSDILAWFRKYWIFIASIAAFCGTAIKFLFDIFMFLLEKE